MTGGALRWHSCSTNDFPLKRHKVSKACEACRGKKMRCDGKNPCQRCESNKIKCIYNDKPARSRIMPTTTTATTTNKKQLPIMISPLSLPDIISPNKITFTNELYETLRLQQTRRYGTSSISPLLLDFFNTTSQPQTIWTYFIVCLNRFFDYSEETTPPEIESNELVVETFRVFTTFNLLYSSFIDTKLLLFVLEQEESLSCFMQQENNNTTYSSMIIYAILAITFQSAYQSLPNIMNENLYVYSLLFYRKAHEIFLAKCFPVTAATAETTTNEKILLVQASVLLTHFQCTLISQEQAFMTIKMGLQLAAALNNEEENNENLFALLKSLNAWYVWLAFYLKKPYSNDELVNISGQDMFIKKSKQQKWALNVVDAFTLFLKNLKSNDSMNIKDSLQNLAISTTINDNEFIPNQIISLYHDILTIQLYSTTCQQQQAIIETKCQHILTTVNKFIFVEYSDTKYIPLSIIYSICIVTQINLARNSRHHDLLLKILKIACPQFLYSKFTTKTTTNQQDMISPSPSSSSSSSCTLNNNELLLADTNTAAIRADIDREQLDKLLSHSKSNSQLQLLLEQQKQYYYLPTANKRSSTTTSNSSGSASASIINEQQYYYNNGQQQQQQKRQHHHQQLYNQFGYPATSSNNKRHRSNTVTSYDSLMMEQEPTNNDAFMYNMWVLEGGNNNNEPSFYNHHQQQQRPFVFAPQENLTKLPLPQPTSIITKNWSAPTQTFTKVFFDSEVQTLHFQTPPLIHFDSLGLNVVDTNTTTTTSLMYPSHRTSIISDSPSSSTHVEDESMEVATAAAAAALWASTAATFKTSGSGSGSCAHGRQGHWINSEKVGDEDYWPE